MRRSIWAAVACLLGLVMTVTAATPALAKDTFDARSSTWLPYWTMPASTSVTRANADLFGTANPFWYDAATCGSVTGYPGAGSTTTINALHAKGLKVVPTFTASGLTPAAAVTCFAVPANRAAHIKKVVAVLASRAYDGVDIDYEHLALTTDAVTAAKVRAAFSAFAADLCKAVNARHRTCDITVMPRTSEAATIWRGKLIPAVYDYAALGKVASHVRIMAYDQNAGKYGPGPIAGYPWVRSIMTYAESKAPKSKLQLGIPLYGRDFYGGTSSTLNSSALAARAASYRLKPTYDATQREYTYSYRVGTTRHTVWFSGARAVADRYALAKARGWAGACYWAAGQEQAGTWAAVRAR